MTVIETKVHRSSARNARVAFLVAAVVAGLLAATVAVDRMHPILALLLGLAAGTASGAVAWVLVRVWPMIRLLWWWAPEIGLALIVVYGWTALATHTHPLVRLAVVGLVVGVPAAIPAVRRRVVALAWCVIVRHRLRVCFAEFILANQSGTLPLILWAHPTPVGERVHLYLRPGLCLADLQTRLDKLAVACHASAVVIERASESSAAYLRVDIKRRDVLAATVDSPLLGLVDSDTPPALRSVPELPSALDLPDVTRDVVTGKTGIRSGAVTAAHSPVPALTSAAATNDDDITDWI